MDQKPLLFSIVILVFIIAVSSCANIVAPQGGPRDSLPPVLISTNPVDSATNFTGNRISFVFDEYVEVQEVQSNLLVSPTPIINPLVEYKLRTLTIKIKDTLEKNTTYAIDLGNALRDINEGNILKNFTYVFTTGDSLDLNELTGRVMLAETGMPDSTLIAVLHRSGEDSAVAKERPRYYAKLDSSGNFRFRYLAPGNYYLYALKDEGGLKRYTGRSQLFAFAEKPVSVSGKAISPTLFAYAEKIPEEGKKKTNTRGVVVTKPKKEEDKRLRFQVNLEGGLQDLLGDLQLSFNDPLKTFDSSKLAFTDNDFRPISGYTITPDSTNKLFTIRYPWKENTEYRLVLDKEFASDSVDRKLLKTDTIEFRSKKQSDYGTLKLRFAAMDLARKPVLQIVQNDKTILTYAFSTAKEYSVKLFNPGEYDLRILYDTNGNGVWDAGSFFGKHLQPERVLHISKKLKIRPNWDNEENITLVAE